MPSSRPSSLLELFTSYYVVVSLVCVMSIYAPMPKNALGLQIHLFYRKVFGVLLTGSCISYKRLNS